MGLLSTDCGADLMGLNPTGVRIEKLLQQFLEGPFLMIIRIKNLRLRTVIGIFDWERKTRQEVVVNVMLEFDGSKAAQSDRIEDSVDYKELTKRIVGEVEQSSFQLIEALANRVLGLVMTDERVRRAEVEIDKPGALRFAESVSVSCSAERQE